MSKNFKIALLVILLTTIFLLRQFFTNAGVPTTHDGQNHLARMANFYIAIKDLQIPPRWASNLNYHYGYPVFNYNYYLAYIPGVFLHVIGFSFEIAYKIIVFGFLLTAGCLFYLFLKKRFNFLSSLLGSILYISSPFTMIQVFVRGHMGTVAGIAVFPIGFIFTDMIFSKSKKTKYLGSMGLIFSILFLALSHNVMFIFGLLIWFLYALFLIYENKNNYKKYFATILVSLILGLGLSAYFILPAFGETNLTNISSVSLSKQFDNHYIYPSQFILSKWGYGYSELGLDDGMSFALGYVQVMLALIALFVVIFKFFVKHENIPIFIIYMLFILIFSLFLMTEYSAIFWNIFSFLKKIQFPWRLMFIANFSIAVISTWIINESDFGLIYLLIFITFVLSIQNSKAKDWWHFTDNFYLEFPFSSSIQNENLPKGFDYYKNQEYKTKVSDIKRGSKINIYKWKSNLHRYEVNASENTIIVEHVAYFPGWIVKVDGNKVAINTLRDPFKGIITYNLDKGNHMVETSFRDRTILRILGDVLSLISLLIITYKILFNVKK